MSIVLRIKICNYFVGVLSSYKLFTIKVAIVYSLAFID